MSVPSATTQSNSIAQQLAAALSLENTSHLMRSQDLKELDSSLNRCSAALGQRLNQLDPNQKTEFAELNLRFVELTTAVRGARSYADISAKVLELTAKVSLVTAKFVPESVVKTIDATGIRPATAANGAESFSEKYPFTAKYLTEAVEEAKAGKYGEEVNAKVSEQIASPTDDRIKLFVRLTIASWLKSQSKSNDQRPEIVSNLQKMIGDDGQSKLMGDEGQDLSNALMNPICRLADDVIPALATTETLPNRKTTPYEKGYKRDFSELVKKVFVSLNSTFKKEFYAAAFAKQHTVAIPGAVTTTASAPKLSVPAATTAATPATAPTATLQTAATTSALISKQSMFSLVDEPTTSKERAAHDSKGLEVKGADHDVRGMGRRNNGPAISSNDKKSNASTLNPAFAPAFGDGTASQTWRPLQSNSGFSNVGLPAFGAAVEGPFLNNGITAQSQQAIDSIMQLISSGDLENVSTLVDAANVRIMSPAIITPFFEKWARALIAKKQFDAAIKIINGDIADELLKGTLLSLIESESKTTNATKPNMPLLMQNYEKQLNEARKMIAAMPDEGQRKLATEQIAKFHEEYMIKINSELALRAAKTGASPASDEKEKASVHSAIPQAAVGTSNPAPKPVAALPIAAATVVSTTGLQTMTQIYEASLGFVVKKTENEKVADDNKANQIKLKLIATHLAKSGKVLGKALDSGDCFFHAFAQSLNVILKKQGKAPVTVIQLRKQVAEYAVIEKNKAWVKKACKDAKEIYDTYVKNIGFAVDSGTVPVWGIPSRDGKILCELYNVNLDVVLGDISEFSNKQAKNKMKDEQSLNKFLEAAVNRSLRQVPTETGLLDAHNASLNAHKELLEKITIGRDSTDSVIISGATETVTIGLYPKHFVPVFNKADVA